MQALLCLPGDRDDVGGLAVLAALQGDAARRGLAVVPAGLDQQPAGVPGSGLGDRALSATLTGAVLRGHQPDVAHQLPGALKPREVADLGAQPGGGERVDPAQAAQPRDGLRVGRGRHELADGLLERAAA